MTKLKRSAFTVGAVLAALVPLLHGAPQAPDQPILDPIPENPIASGLGLTVEEFASFPKSEPVPTPTDPRLVVDQQQTVCHGTSVAHRRSLRRLRLS